MRGSQLLCDGDADRDHKQVLNHPAPVYLHVYDMGHDQMVRGMNRVLRTVGAGAFHCGVEIHGTEWSYQGCDSKDTGIFDCIPRHCETHTYSETVHMGNTRLSKAQVLILINKLKQGWIGSGYHIVKNNCCNFCEHFCQLLVNEDIPEWVNNLASTGAAILEMGECKGTQCKEPENWRCLCKQAASPETQSDIPEIIVVKSSFGQLDPAYESPPIKRSREVARPACEASSRENVAPQSLLNQLLRESSNDWSNYTTEKAIVTPR